MTRSRAASRKRRVQRRLVSSPALVEAMSGWLRVASGTMLLRPIQAAGLLDLALYGGALIAARVGAGKTLMAGLAPTVCKARRPLLVVPANLREDTKRLLAEYRKHWRIPSSAELRVVSYHKLSSKKAPRYLWDFAPDLVIFDEVHRLKNVRGAKCARRVARYLHEFPAVRFLGLTGTPVRKSIRDYAHILRWATRSNCPIPANDDLVAEWAALLDDQDAKDWTQPWDKIDYSILEPWLCEPGDPPITDKDEAREAYGRALELTPGVVISTECYDGVGLEICPKRIVTPEAMDPAWEDLRERWVLPDGWDLADKTEKLGVWGAACQLALGFYLHPDPWPPEDWFQARREWCRFSRRVLEESCVYDSETDVRDACLAGDLPDHAWKAWEEIRDSHTYTSVPVWLSEHALLAAQDWGRGGGIVWTRWKAFAQALSELTGWPYYGAQGRDAQGQHITRATAPTIIASEWSNTDGRNLQRDVGPGGLGYCRNLFCTPPKTALDWEQRTGRTHRDGQTRDVLVDYFVGCRENLVAVPTAIAYAHRTAIAERMTLKLIQPGVEVTTPPENWAQGPAY